MRGFRSKEFLEKLGCVDTAPRVVGKNDRILVRCTSCNNAEKEAKMQVLVFVEKKFNRGWICQDCGFKIGAEKRKIDNPVEGVSRKASAMRSEELLKELKAVDTSPRVIRATDKIEFSCWTCKATSFSRFNNIYNSFKKLGHGWTCKDCTKALLSQLASEKVGEKNPFYGKSHDKYAKMKNSEAAFKRVMSLSEEERFKLGQKMSAAFKDKHGTDNPMKIKEFIDNWNKGIESVGDGPSKGESEIFEFVQSLGFIPEKKYIREDESKPFKEIDVFVKEVNVGIEHNGLGCHSEKYKDRLYHRNKYLLAKNNDIKLLQFFSNEWYYRKDQCKNFIRSALGKNKNKVGAREVEVREITKDESSEFLNNYHIQGANPNSTYSLGAFYNEELLAVASFGTHHRINDQIVLNRLAFKEDWSVVGFLSKVSGIASQYFKKDLYTWADLRFSSGEGYRRSGWEIHSNLDPDYFYSDGHKVIAKQSRRKSLVSTPEDETEAEHAIRDGLYRIWDCGKIKFVYKYK